MLQGVCMVKSLFFTVKMVPQDTCIQIELYRWFIVISQQIGKLEGCLPWMLATALLRCFHCWHFCFLFAVDGDGIVSQQI